MRYRIEQVRREWNRYCKKQYQIPDTKEAKQALHAECRSVHECTGHRELELPSYSSKEGIVRLITF